MFEDMEFNPMAAGLGLVGGVLSIFVMSKVEVALIFKILSFVFTTILCYIVASRIGEN